MMIQDPCVGMIFFTTIIFLVDSGESINTLLTIHGAGISITT